MKLKLLLGLFFVLVFLPNVHAASCNNPDTTFSLASDRTSENSSFVASLTVDAGGSPVVGCVCPLGENCKWQVQFRELTGGSWTNVPQNTSLPDDFNCSGVSCTNLLDHQQGSANRTVFCVDQGAFEFRAHRPYLSKDTMSVKITCYPFGPQCVPPATGNFYLNDHCEYVNVPVPIDQNFNILASGRAVQNGSDINFFGSGANYLNIKNGGRIDLNKSSVFAGINNPSSLIGFGFLSILSFLVLFLSRPLLFSKEVAA